MARGFQDTGKIDLVDGKTIERFLCIQTIDEETKAVEPLIFWLKRLKKIIGTDFSLMRA